MKSTIVYLMCLFSFFSQAQKIEIGEIKKIQSEYLDEQREYWVFLPEHYSDEKYKEQQYPVIYLLDGEKYFHVVSGIVKNLSNGYYPQMPECIVVAIKNTDRSRDLTPTSNSKSPNKFGGADKFEDFVCQELIPEINRSYKTLDYKILIGHSFGGLFVFNTLLKNTKYFNGYIAIDPSLWWDKEFVVRELKSAVKRTDFKGSTLFFANANSVSGQKNPSKQHYAHAEAKEKAIEIMETTVPENLNSLVKTYANEDHGSVVLPSFIDGLRFVFKGFRIDVKALIKNPSILEQQYQDLSSKLGFVFQPQCAFLDKVVDLSLKKGQKENAEILHAMNKNLYPGNIYIRNKFN